MYGNRGAPPEKITPVEPWDKVRKVPEENSLASPPFKERPPGAKASSCRGGLTQPKRDQDKRKGRKKQQPVGHNTESGLGLEGERKKAGSRPNTRSLQSEVGVGTARVPQPRRGWRWNPEEQGIQRRSGLGHT